MLQIQRTFIFVNDPAGACGYYSPFRDAIAIRKSCSAPNSTTLVHELGHFFSLPHTFNGWENGAVPTNPEKVTRTGPSANCSSTGDKFCDTEADYQGERWFCPYNDIKFDSNNDQYHPDSSIYMGYASDECMTRFSNMEIAAMQFNQSTRTNLTASFPGWQNLAMPNIT